MRLEGALAALATAALVAVVPAVASAAPVRALLSVRVNGVERGEALVQFDDGEAWMALAELESAGLRGIGGRRAILQGQEHVALSSLAPALQFAVDERALRLSLTAGPELLGRERLDLGSARPAGVVEAREPSAFLNYSAQTGADLHPSLAAEVGVGDRRRLFVSGLDVTPQGAVVRGLSTASVEDPERLRRWVVGDGAVSMGGLGSSAIVGGLGFVRDFSLDPYYVESARPATTAFVASPSTLEVYVNGALMRRQEVAPGTIDLADIPVTAGTNSVRTVLRDAYGREQTFDLRSVYSSGLLARGVTDYGYHIGFVRDDFGTSSFGYRRPVALARHRLGITEAITGGARLEAGLDRGNLGCGVAMGTILGELDAEAAGSVERARTGSAALLSLTWNVRRASVGMRLRGTTAEYSAAALDFAADRALLEAAGFAGLRLADRLGLGLEVSAARWRGAGNLANVTARTDIGLGSRFALLVTGTATVRGGATAFSGQLLLSWFAGGGTTAQVASRAGPEGVGASLGAQRSLPQGPGYGYRVEAAAGAPQARGTADLQWQTQYGRFEAQAEQTQQGRGGSLTAAGGAVLIGGRAFLTRPVEASYGLMRVGVPDVRGYLENQEVGSTDSRGDLLVPSLQPRYANRLKIRASDIPMEYEVGKLEQLIGPPLKRGAVAHFDVTPIRAVMGQMEIEGRAGASVPSRAALELKEGAETRTAVLTSDGRFFLEHVTAGRHDGALTWQDGSCRFSVDVPDRTGVLNLGALRCTPEATALAP